MPRSPQRTKQDKPGQGNISDEHTSWTKGSCVSYGSCFFFASGVVRLDRMRQMMSRLFGLNTRNLWPRDASPVMEGAFVQTDDLGRHRSQTITLPSHCTALKHPETET